MEGAGHGKRLPFSNDREHFSHRGHAMKIIVLAHPKDNQQPLFSEAWKKPETQRRNVCRATTIIGCSPAEAHAG
jgi:hypothetical protein